jgi:hypothetical protein
VELALPTAFAGVPDDNTHIAVGDPVNHGHELCIAEDRPTRLGAAVQEVVLGAPPRSRAIRARTRCEWRTRALLAQSVRQQAQDVIGRAKANGLDDGYGARRPTACDRRGRLRRPKRRSRCRLARASTSSRITGNRTRP